MNINAGYKDLGVENPWNNSNSPVILDKISRLGCKGSQVQILSRRPISPTENKQLQNSIHKWAEMLIANLIHSYPYLFKFGCGKSVELECHVSGVLISDQSASADPLMIVSQSNNKSKTSLSRLA